MNTEQNQICLSKKQISIMTAILIVLGLLIFIVGYFWGKHTLIEGFTQKTVQESFNDQVDYALTMQSFTDRHGPLVDASEEAGATAVKLLENLPGAIEENEESNENKIQKLELLDKVEKPKFSDVDVIKDQRMHYAAIAGFAKKSLALAMINRLKKHHIDVEMKTRSSNSSQKIRKYWYQVVTKSYSSQQEVQKIVDKILSVENLSKKSIKIY